MGLTVTTDDKGVRVFANEKTTSDGKKFLLYSIAISSKDKDGRWANGYLNCRFKKDVVVNNKAKIKINNAFFTVSKSNGKAYTPLMITDFEVLEEGEAGATVDGDGFVSMEGINDSDLPFAD